MNWMNSHNDYNMVIAHKHYHGIIRPRCMRAVHKMWPIATHVARSVVCLSVGHIEVLCKKRLNRSSQRCSLGADTCGIVQSSITACSGRDHSIPNDA